MFFFIGGIQPKTVLVDKQARSCSRCGHVEVYLKRVDHYVSIFFIPLVPVSRGKTAIVCERCGGISDEMGRGIGIGATRDVLLCKRCGRELERKFTFCPYCGERI